jgi:hypothetical protein
MDQMSANQNHSFVLSFDATQNYSSRFLKLRHKVAICAMVMVNSFSNNFCKFSKTKEQISYTALIVHLLEGFAPVFGNCALPTEIKSR